MASLKLWSRLRKTALAVVVLLLVLIAALMVALTAIAKVFSTTGNGSEANTSFIVEIPAGYWTTDLFADACEVLNAGQVSVRLTDDGHPLEIVELGRVNEIEGGLCLQRVSIVGDESSSYVVELPGLSAEISHEYAHRGHDDRNLEASVSATIVGDPGQVKTEPCDDDGTVELLEDSGGSLLAYRATGKIIWIRYDGFDPCLFAFGDNG